MHVVITGASRGIGLEFVRQYLARGDRVTAACRAPDRADDLHRLACDRLRVLARDVGDDASVAAFGAAVGEGPIDLLINNAGVMGEWASLHDMSMAGAMQTFSVNALGPLRETRALMTGLLSR